MATQWMRWNETTHIFEYSTDGGANYVPLPLNASVLNEGVVSSGQLPPGGGNVVGPASSTATAIATYTDTTGKLIKNNPAITVDASGNILVTQNVAGLASIRMDNANTGVSGGVSILFGNSVGANRGQILFTGSGNTGSSYVADGLVLYSSGGGGILINAGAAAAIAFRTTNTVRMSIAAGGPITFSAAIIGTSIDLSATLDCTTITCTGVAVSASGAITTAGTVTTGGVIANGTQSATLAGANATVALSANVSILRITGGGFSIQTISGGVSGRVIYLCCISGTFTLATGGNISIATGTIANGQMLPLVFDGTLWRAST